MLDDSVLLIDKPSGWTSFDVVAKIRNTLKVKKVGHAGTLDPLATGLLILCTGRKTKEISEIQNADKEYLVEFQLGATTPSYDAEFEPENHVDASHLTIEMLAQAMRLFTGEIDQRPPNFSAVKVKGKRAYELARRGVEMELQPKKVKILEFTLLEFLPGALVHARVRCSKGTYIRSLVHDLGQRLGVGAYMTNLRRTAIGNYRIEQADTVADFLKKYSSSISTTSTPE